MNGLHLHVKDQFPGFVQADFPAFIEFVQEYYKWLGSLNPDSIERLMRLDSTPVEFVEYFRKQYDVYGITRSADPSNVRYLTNIKEFYTSKGSEDGLVAALRILANVDAAIDYPIEYVLKPSDGKWDQESFITLTTRFGSIDDIELWDFTNDCRCAVRRQQIPVSRTEVIDQATIRLYFKSRQSLILFVGQLIDVFDVDGNTIYRGEIILSPTTLSILIAGADWQIGQVVRFPGQVSDTIARVTAIVPGGGIKHLEILEQGFPFGGGEQLQVSPYDIKPIGATFDLTQEQVSPTITHYTLSVFDATDGSIDSIEGYGTGPSYGLYALPGYFDEIYSGDLIINRSTTNAITPVGDSNISLERWLASRAVLTYNFGPVSTLKGRWLDDSGKISSETIRIQDSLYYQQFSYVIESTSGIDTYKQLADSMHIAGTKMFTKQNIEATMSITPSVEITFPFISLNLLDVVPVTDVVGKIIDKYVEDTQTIQDAVAKQTTHFASDTVEALSADTSAQTDFYEYYFDEEYSVIAEAYAEEITLLAIPDPGE